ncbi:hypothetical protein [uncultured Clostridium sp.]|uniref:hypothetical protein n=1 Tax=uncultured Clostridium sp. TaxID=59620 RepID=UPI00263B5086|nr:hypothetical protein [uncultured Clostridium sp.]
MFDPTSYVAPRKRPTPLLDCIVSHGYDMKIGMWEDGTKKYQLVPYVKSGTMVDIMIAKATQPKLYSEPGENLKEFLTRLGWLN